MPAGGGPRIGDVARRGARGLLLLGAGSAKTEPTSTSSGVNTVRAAARKTLSH